MKSRYKSTLPRLLGGAAVVCAAVTNAQAIFFGSIAGFIVWIFALLFRLSPARRLELRTYPEIESVAAQYAEAK